MYDMVSTCGVSIYFNWSKYFWKYHFCIKFFTFLSIIRCQDSWENIYLTLKYQDYHCIHLLDFKSCSLTFCRLRTSMSLSCFLKPAISSFFCFSRRLLSDTSWSRRFLSCSVDSCNRIKGLKGLRITESKDWKFWMKKSKTWKVRGWKKQRTERPEWQKGVNDWCLNDRIKGWRNQRQERSEDDRIKGLKGQNDKIKELRGLNDRIKGLKDLNAIKNFIFYCL